MEARDIELVKKLVKAALAEAQIRVTVSESAWGTIENALEVTDDLDWVVDLHEANLEK